MYGRGYRPEIDGLRAVAVTIVVFFHAGFELFSGGFVGVDVFFVISGFLITRIITSELQAGTFTLRNFWERRARRILPALLLVITFCIPVAWLLLAPSDMRDFGTSVVAAVTFSANFFFWRNSGYFEPAAELQPLLHTWSLAVEEQFYLLFPLFMLLMWRRFKTSIPVFLAIVFALSFALSQIASSGHQGFNFYLLPTRGWELLIGAFIALQIDRVRLGERLSSLATYLGMGLIFTAVFLLDASVPFPGVYALLPTLGAALVIVGGGGKRNSVTKLLQSPPVVYVGLISYSLYLWHHPILAFLRYHNPEVESLEILGGLILSFLLASFTYALVEKPFRAPGRRRNKAAIWVPATVVLVSLGFFLSSGFSQKLRFTEPELAVFDEYTYGGAFVVRKFNNLEMADFDHGNEITKILIIGDSYAQDLVNIVHESDLDTTISLSTHYISRRCGNVFTSEDLTRHIHEDDRANCAEQPGYGSPELLAQIKSADQVWLASSWKWWTFDFLEDTTANITKLSKAKIVIFGTKSFGARSASDYLGAGVAGMLSEKRAISLETSQLMERMAEEVPKYATYIDIQMAACGDYKTCSNTINGRLPLSYDGGHLSPSGASQIGEALSKDINEVLRQ